MEYKKLDNETLEKTEMLKEKIDKSYLLEEKTRLEENLAEINKILSNFD